VTKADTVMLLECFEGYRQTLKDYELTFVYALMWNGVSIIVHGVEYGKQYVEWSMEFFLYIRQH